VHKGLATRQPCLARGVPKTSVDIDNARDVVAFLTTQHQQIKQLFTDITAARGDNGARPSPPSAGYPRCTNPPKKRPSTRGRGARSAGMTPLSTLASRKQAKKQLAELDSLDVDNAEFETNFQALQTDVLQHADHEEQREFAAMLA
jgi:hypothetical protein